MRDEDEGSRSKPECCSVGTWQDSGRNALALGARAAAEARLDDNSIGVVRHRPQQRNQVPCAETQTRHGYSMVLNSNSKKPASKACQPTVLPKPWVFGFGVESTANNSRVSRSGPF